MSDNAHLPPSLESQVSSDIQIPAAPFTLRHEALSLLIVSGLVVFLYLLSLSHILFSGDASKLIGIGDFHTLNGPKAFFLDIRLQHGEFPLWDPLTLTGIPYAAHPLTMSFYPPNLARAFITRPANAVEFLYSLYLFVLFHMLVVATGLYLLARREGISRPPAIVLSTAVPFCQIWLYFSLDQMPMVCTVAWTPIVLLCLREAAHCDLRRTCAGWTIVAGIVYGLQILAGWPQAAIYLTILYVVYIVIRFTFQGLRRPFSFKGAGRLAGSIVWAGALFGIVGALIGLALVLPAAELIRLSSRSSTNYKLFTNTDEVNIPSLALLHVARQRYEAGPLSYVRAIADEADRWFSLNLGLNVVAFSSLLLLRRARVLVYLIVTLLAFDLTFGPPMPVSILFEKYAPFTTSSPFYTTVIVAIPLALLAGFALDAFLCWGSAGPLPRRASAVLVGLAVPIVSLASEPPDFVPIRSLAWSLLPAAIVALIAFGRGLRHWRTLVIGALLAEIALCAIPIIRVCFERTGYMKPSFASDPKILEQPVNPELRGARIICDQANHQVWAGESAVNGFDPLTLYAAFEPLADPGTEKRYARGLPVAKNLRVASLFKRTVWLAPAFVRGQPPDKSRLFPSTAAVFIDSPDPVPLPELTLNDLPASSIAVASQEIELQRQEAKSGRASTPNMQMVTTQEISFSRRNHALRVYYRTPGEATLYVKTVGAANPIQRFSTGPAVLSPSGDRESFFEMPLPDFETATMEVTIQSDTPLTPNVVTRLTLIEDLADETDHVVFKVNRANTLVLDVKELLAPRALVLTEMNYPGWTATLDGADAPILDAYGCYKAVIVPAGTHEVAFHFRPWRVFVGASVSITTLILAGSTACGLLLWGRRRRAGSDGQAADATISPAAAQ